MTAIEAITVEIDLIMGLIAADSTATIVQILEIHASFARDQTADPRSIYRRNKMQKRLDLGLKTSVDLRIGLADPVTSKSVLLMPIYSMWPKSRAKMTMT
jgi:hypothetical protein